MVTNTQKTFSSAVSGTVLSFMFSLARGVYYCNFLKNKKKLSRVNFDKITEYIQDVYGQNILIVGLGEIGSKVARSCSAGDECFFCKKKKKFHPLLKKL